MVEELKEKVFKANLDLVKHGLVIFTWGNVSAIDRKKGLVVIKPSGVSYETMKTSDMVVLDLDGNVMEGNLKPSSDTPTHLVLYKAFPQKSGELYTHTLHMQHLGRRPGATSRISVRHMPIISVMRYPVPAQ